MRRTLVLMVAVLPPLLSLDIPGTGESPVPGPLPEAWFAWQNDGFGASFGLDSDDHRTNGFSAGATWKGFVLGIDSSMLTARLPDGGGRRVDELTTSLGYEASAGWLRARVGGGARATGNLGGNLLQQRAHRFLAQQRFDLDYDRDAPDWDPLAYGRLGLEIPVWGPLRLEPRALALGTGGGQLQAQAGARIVAVGRSGSWWAGLDHHWRSGDAPTVTQDVVAVAEHGNWLSLGVAVDAPPWQLGFTLGRNLDNDEQQGAFLIGGSPERMGPPVGRWRGEFGAMFASTGEKGRGQEYRLLWGPFEAPWLEFAIDARDWAPSTEDPGSLSARTLSLGGGTRISWRCADPGWSPVVSVDAGIAWHTARIRALAPVEVDGGDSRQVSTGVVHGGPAMGAGWCSARGMTFAAVLAMDIRQPLRSTTVRIREDDGSGVDFALVEREIVPVVRVTASLAW